MIVKYTTELFLEQDNRKSEPIIKEFNHSPPKNSKFGSFNYNMPQTKINNLFDVQQSPNKKNK